ncbi:MAG: pyruvate kinase [Oscillospiraceae bacterium]|nr:pyruvate kinase [Oscillospiraceae bacterium]
MRKTKLVCTLGPASDSEDVIRAMLLAGMDVARLNFSHSTHAAHAQTIARFRKVRDELGKSAAVILDTKGPEIRIGAFAGGAAQLEAGAEFTLVAGDVPGDATQVSVSYAALADQLEPGARLLLDDGKLEFRVLACADARVRCRVVQGGLLKDHKSINIPGARLDMPFLSERDQEDLLFGIAQDVDFVAASFVRRKEDVIALRKFLNYHKGHDIRIIAKIENMEGIENFHEILEHSDGIMVARGDMGVEVAYEKLPGLQKKFIRACYQSGKMVITATQMLESMVTSPNPTRAEITDVANAVFDGTSAVMLSGESAAGQYPVRAVEVMAKIAEQAEEDAFSMDVFAGIRYDMDATDTTNAICDATCTTARDLHAAAVIAVTKSGQTARRMSKFRPFEPIIAATPKVKTFQQLSLSWGVYAVLAEMQASTDELFVHAVDCAQQLDIVHDGDVVVITAGIPLGHSGTTNLLKVQRVGGPFWD